MQNKCRQTARRKLPKIKPGVEAKLKEIRAVCEYYTRYKNVYKNTCTIKFYGIHTGFAAAAKKAEELFPCAVLRTAGTYSSHGASSLVITFNHKDIFE